MNRFWNKVDRRGPDDCWPWQASQIGNGYGQFNLGGRPQPAHRVALMLSGVEIPEGMQVDHIWQVCSSILCCNPRHLEVVTQQENLRRQFEAVRARPCRRGHPPSDRRINSKGETECAECVKARDRARGRERYARRKQLLADSCAQ